MRRIPFLKHRVLCTVLLLPLLTLMGYAQKTPQDSKEAKPPVKVHKKTGIEFVAIPAGSFDMGGDKYDDEKPVHKVELSKFYMSKTELTVGQYKAYCKATGRKMPGAPAFNAGWGKKDHPIVNVSWKDAKGYCDWAGVSLPTEAEWEYAARGGLSGKAYPWGDEWDAGKLRCSTKSSGDSGGTAVVGSYAGNGYGLHDMSGNVCEWCADWYDGGYYAKSPPRNPRNSTTANVYVLRDGAWYGNNPGHFRCADRDGFTPYGSSDVVGFRVVFRGLL